MATSGDLARALAVTLGLPETTVLTYYRRLREAGLMPKAGRGPASAAKMTAAAAATLITAIGGRCFENEPVADVIERYRKVKSFVGELTYASPPDDNGKREGDRWGGIGFGGWFFDKITVPFLDHLENGHTIEETIEALIVGEFDDGTSEEWEWRSNWEAALEGKGVKSTDITITFDGPEPRAEVQIVLHNEDGSMYLCFVEFWSEKMIARFNEPNPPSVQETEDEKLSSWRHVYQMFQGDLLITRKFTNKTISRAADVLDKEDRDARWKALWVDEEVSSDE